MKHRWLALVATLLPTVILAQGGPAHGPYARIALFRPLDGQTVEFEAGYIRHLAWHRGAKDTWTWYGYTINYSERRFWFIYATFGHTPDDFDHAVDPAGDNQDNTMNVAPHVDSWNNSMYEFLPAFSRGTGVPSPTAMVEMTTVDLKAGTTKAFEAALTAGQSGLQDETLWYRMMAGGPVPRYLRLRPLPSLSAIIDRKGGQALPDKVDPFITKTTVEVLSLRPTMSYNLTPAP